MLALIGLLQRIVPRADRDRPRRDRCLAGSRHRPARPMPTAMARRTRLLERLVGCGDPRLGVVEPALRGERPPERELRRPDLLEVVDAAAEQSSRAFRACVSLSSASPLSSRISASDEQT